MTRCERYFQKWKGIFILDEQDLGDQQDFGYQEAQDIAIKQAEAMASESN